jgi:parallel beta-helix repeat protein
VVLSTSPDYGVEAAGNRELTAEFELLAANRLPASVTTDSLLTADHSPYVATRDLVIRPGAKLIVNAGVELRFQAGASLVVQGALSVYGREGKPVRLQAADPSRPWGALCFQNTTDSCVLNWTEVTGATHGPDSAVYKAAVSAVGSVLLLDHVSIGPSPQPFYGRNGRITLRRCSLDGTEAGDDILNVQVALCTIEDSYFFGEGELDFDSVDGGVIRNTRVRSTSVNNNRDCVDIGASQNVLLENNVVEEGSDKGFSIGEGSTVTLRGNTVAGCLRGIAVKDNSFARIDRNTIYGCVTGLDLYEKTPGLGGGRATVTNTVFSGSSEADIKTDALSSVLVTYSLSDRLVFQGEGNRKGDPLFKAPAQLDFRLRPGSPCIDTGDPAAIRDPDGTRADMGAMPYNAALGRYGRLSINEVMAQNASFACDEKWEYDDWIEIYNGSASPVDMGGLYLTDDIRRPFLSRIPDGEAQSTTVPAGGYRVLWADGDTAQGPMHLGFRLSGTGESVVLIAMDGAVALVLDSLRFGRQTADASFGRVPDGAGPGDKLMNPTPGWTNLGGGDAAFRLVSPSQDTTVSLPENSGSAVVFRWTRPDLPDASLAGARFVLSVDNLTAGTSVLDTVAETSRTLAFAPGTDGRLRWRVLALLADGRVLVSDQRRAALGSPASADPAIAVPDRFMLLPPYPNPFNPSVTIRFALPGRADVRLVVYDVQGRCVRELVRCAVPAGFHDAEWDGKDASGLTVSSGIYILKLTAGNRSAIRKATLLR